MIVLRTKSRRPIKSCCIACFLFYDVDVNVCTIAYVQELYAQTKNAFEAFKMHPCKIKFTFTRKHKQEYAQAHSTMSSFRISFEQSLKSLDRVLFVSRCNCIFMFSFVLINNANDAPEATLVIDQRRARLVE